MLLGAGRLTKDDVIDMSAGITMHKKAGDAVRKGEPICTFYGRPETFAAAEEMYRSGLVYSTEKPREKPLVYARVTADGVEMLG